MVHQCQGLTFRLEPRDNRVRVHSGLDDLQRHLAMHGPVLFGHVDDPEPALANLLQQLVAADFVAWTLTERRWGHCGLRFG